MRFQAIGDGIHVLLVLGFPPLPPNRNYNRPPTLSTQSLQLKNSLPIGPRTSPPLTSLMLSQQTFRLKIIAFSSESCGDELIISAENNTSPQSLLPFALDSTYRPTRVATCSSNDPGRLL